MVEITQLDFWESFWANVQLPCTVDMSYKPDRVIAEVLLSNLPKGDGTALEIGCAPGKWMVFLSKDLGYAVAGCEYVPSAVRTTYRNLELCGISDSKIFTGDFNTVDLGDQHYDLVFSLGFIEHFSNPAEIIQRMVNITIEGGFLVIGVPKFTGLNYYLAKIVDKTLDTPILSSHNIDIMSLGYFEEIATTFGLEKIFIDHVGGYEPAMYDFSRTSVMSKLLFYALQYGLDNRFFRFLNLGWYSSYIIAIYQKL